MRTFSECYLCIVQQATSAMIGTRVDEYQKIETLRKISEVLGEISPTISPSEIANRTNRIIREETGIDDLYAQIKSEGTQLALSIYSDLVNLIPGDHRKLEMALQVSAAGNVIDVIHQQDYDLWSEVEQTTSQPLLGNGLIPFSQKIQEVDHLLILADNSGETVFDRVLIETLGIPVVYAVKGGAILNDATYAEAIEAGLGDVAKIVETGSRGPGTILHDCSPEFQKIYRESKLVLAKGQANYETLDKEGEKVFFLLRIKCPIIGREIGYPVGNLVFEQGAS